MNFIVFSGPPSSGKTSVILKTISALKQQGISVGVVKFDCLHTDDDKLYEKEGVLVRKGLSGALCPDHFFASNIEEVVQWGNQNQLDLLITESAGLCNRCSPYLAEIKGVCIIDNLSGINTPKKIGPMLKSADFVVITKGDIELSTLLYDKNQNIQTLEGMKLRFPMPAALCSYCLGETRIGKQYQLGNVRKMNWEEEK